MSTKIITGCGFESNDFTNAVEHFPDHILPPQRKKRPYISSILSKNEVSREDKYNRKLFLRIRHGNYIINPRLSLRVEGEWRNIYNLLSVDMIASMELGGSRRSMLSFNQMLQQDIVRFSANIERYIETGDWGKNF